VPTGFGQNFSQRIPNQLKILPQHVKKTLKYDYKPETQVYDMAENTGLKEHYEQGYRALSWIDHLDPTTTLPRVKTGILKFDPDYDPDIDKKYFTEALNLNLSYFRNICQSIAEIFNLTMKDDFEKFSKIIKNFDINP
jgi:hypothetical protein